MFWYKPANLAFDLEKLFMDRFFAAVREVLPKRVTSLTRAWQQLNFRPRIWSRFISQSDGRILTYKKNHFVKRQCGSTDCSVVVSGRKIRSQSCVRLHCISFTALATASCHEIKIEKETLGTDNLF